MRCKATKINGEPCGAFALKGGEFCYMHDPERDREELSRRSTRTQEPLPAKVRKLDEVLAILDHALRSALILENSTARGQLLVDIASEYTKLISMLEDKEG